MDYLKNYKLLIRKARNRNVMGYTESHHIIPKSLGGKNHKKNLVKLYPKEHFIAHLLLWKLLQKRYGSENKRTVKMLYAVTNFLFRKSTKSADYKITSRTYERLKQEWSLYQKSKVGEKHHRFGMKHSESSKNKMSSSLKGKCPWNKGLILPKQTQETIDKRRISNSKPRGKYRDDSHKNRKEYQIQTTTGKTLQILGMAKFCRDNPEYKSTIMSKIVQGKYPLPYKDIINIKEMEK